MEIYGIRHAQAEHNAEKVKHYFNPLNWFSRYKGIYNSKLTKKGIKQAHKTREKWISLINRTTLVLVSPLIRTLETAKIIFKDTS